MYREAKPAYQINVVNNLASVAAYGADTDSKMSP